MEGFSFASSEHVYSSRLVNMYVIFRIPMQTTMVIIIFNSLTAAIPVLTATPQRHC